MVFSSRSDIESSVNTNVLLLAVVLLRMKIFMKLWEDLFYYFKNIFRRLKIGGNKNLKTQQLRRRIEKCE